MVKKLGIWIFPARIFFFFLLLQKVFGLSRQPESGMWQAFFKNRGSSRVTSQCRQGEDEGERLMPKKKKKRKQ